MIPDEISQEYDDVVAIRVTEMPDVVFRELWSGLSSSEDLFGPSAEIEAARNWLNFTMQGVAEGEDTP